MKLKEIVLDFIHLVFSVSSGYIVKKVPTFNKKMIN